MSKLNGNSAPLALLALTLPDGNKPPNLLMNQLHILLKYLINRHLRLMHKYTPMFSCLRGPP